MATRTTSRHPFARLLGISSAVLFLVTTGPAYAVNQPWRVEQIPSRAPAVGCANVIAQTAREAVQRCLAKVGVSPLPFEDFIVTAGVVCKTTQVATAVNNTALVGYVYSLRLSRVLRPACP